VWRNETPASRKAWADAAQIAQRYQDGEWPRRIAADFGCNPGTIARIVVANGVPLKPRGGNKRAPLFPSRRDYSRAYYADNRARMLARNKLNSYGLSPEAYEELHEAQGGRCAICLEPERARNRRGEIQPLAVDHDHATRRVRGLLCAECNIGLGKFRDRPDLLRAAVVYLEWRTPRGED
jgi:hypothetical protein